MSRCQCGAIEVSGRTVRSVGWGSITMGVMRAVRAACAVPGVQCVKRVQYRACCACSVSQYRTRSAYSMHDVKCLQHRACSACSTGRAVRSAQGVHCVRNKACICAGQGVQCVQHRARKYLRVAHEVLKCVQYFPFPFPRPDF